MKEVIEIYYSRKYIKSTIMWLANPSLCFLIYFFINFSSHGHLTDNARILIYFILITTPITLFLNGMMIDTPYITISQNQITKINFGFFFWKKSYLFDHIVESHLTIEPEIKSWKKYFNTNWSRITFYTKKGFGKHIFFMTMTKEDKQKIIEIFKEKGKLYRIDL